MSPQAEPHKGCCLVPQRDRLRQCCHHPSAIRPQHDASCLGLGGPFACGRYPPLREEDARGWFLEGVKRVVRSLYYLLWSNQEHFKRL